MSDRIRTARQVVIDDPNTPPTTGTRKYRCEVHLYPRNGSGFLAVAAAIPGVAATGQTEAEALVEITRAFATAIRGYTAEGGKVPWLPEPLPPQSGGTVRLVFPQV